VISIAARAIPLSCCLVWLAACTAKPKGVEIDALDLVPTQANLVAGFHVDPIKASPMGGPIYTAMAADPDMGAVVTGFEECEIETANLTGVLAMDIESEDMVGIIEAPGIGSEKKMKCLEREAAKADGEFSGLMIFETHGSVRRVAQEGGGWLVILNPNAVAFVEGRFEDELFARIENPDQRTRPPALAAALDRVDHTHDIWGAFVIDEAFRADLADFEGSEKATDIGVALDFDAGLGMEVRVGFPDDATAQRDAFEGAAKLVLEMTKGEILAAGVPEATVESLKIAKSDDAVSLTGQVPADELTGFGAMAMALMAEG